MDRKPYSKFPKRPTTLRVSTQLKYTRVYPRYSCDIELRSWLMICGMSLICAALFVWSLGR